MSNYLQSTINLINQLTDLRCPICGKKPFFSLDSEKRFTVAYCHEELNDLCDETANAIIEANQEQSGYKTLKVKLRTPPSVS